MKIVGDVLIWVCSEEDQLAEVAEHRHAAAESMLASVSVRLAVGPRYVRSNCGRSIGECKWEDDGARAIVG